MDYNHTEQPNMNFQQPPFNPYRKKPNRMANLYLILGVLTLLSVISIYFIYMALPLGCMSILFAHLSKGDSYRLSPKAVGGMTVSILAILITVVILVLGFYLAIQLFGLETLMDPDALQKAISDLYNQLPTQLPMTGGGSL